MKPTDQFVAMHSIFKGLAHLVGNIQASEKGIVLEFASKDLKMK